MAAAAVSAPLRVLFVPVSGLSGMGEYARCLTLAGAVAARWPGAAIHFLLSAEAPYARSTPHPYTLLPGSPTLHNAAACAAIREFAPDVTVFDNSGRKSQLMAARACGGRTVFVSSRWRPRLKAFRLRWMRHLDEHWIPYPEFVGGSLTRLERLKQRLLGRPRVRYLDVVLPPPPAAAAAVALARAGVAPEGYVLVVPGGGSVHPGAIGTPAAFETAAQRIAAAGHVVLVAGRDRGVAAPNVEQATAAEQAPAAAQVRPSQRDGSPRWLGRVPPVEIAALLRGATLVVTNGGDTLLQALAAGRATVAAPIANDQPQRLARCVARGGVIGVAPQPGAIASAALRLLDDASERARLAAAARALGLVDGVATALEAIAALAGRAGAS